MADQEKDKSKKPQGEGSPWLKGQKPSKDREPEVEIPEEIPDEVYDQTLADDDEKMEVIADQARLMGTMVPPDSRWPVCWACGERMPMLMRDPADGTLVCKGCATNSALRMVLMGISEILGGVQGTMGAYIQALGKAPQAPTGPRGVAKPPESTPEGQPEPKDEAKKPSKDEG